MSEPKITVEQLQAAEEWLDSEDADALRASVFEDGDAVSAWVDELALRYAALGMVRASKEAQRRGEEPDLAKMIQAMVAAALETGIMLHKGVQDADD